MENHASEMAMGMGGQAMTDHGSTPPRMFHVKRLRTEEERRAASEKMKAFHLKTKAGTKMGNAMARKARRK